MLRTQGATVCRPACARETGRRVVKEKSLVNKILC